MNWLNKTPTDLFYTIPEDTLSKLVAEKQQIQEFDTVSKLKVSNQLMTRHILNKHHLPSFITNQEELIRWIFCLYVIE